MPAVVIIVFSCIFSKEENFLGWASATLRVLLVNINLCLFLKQDQFVRIAIKFLLKLSYDDLVDFILLSQSLVLPWRIEVFVFFLEWYLKSIFMRRQSMIMNLLRDSWVKFSHLLVLLINVVFQFLNVKLKHFPFLSHIWYSELQSLHLFNILCTGIATILLLLRCLF